MRVTTTTTKTEADKYREEVKANREASAALMAELAATVDARRNGNVADAPLMAERIDAARLAAHASDHIDHTPGGSPGFLAGVPTAPAPRYTVATGYIARRKVPRKDGAPMAWQEAWSRCRAAARLELGEAFSDDDREDCAAYVAEHLAHAIPGGFKAETFPADWASMMRLRRHAGHWRRDYIRRADRTEDIDAAAEAGFSPRAIEADPVEVLTVDQAHARARDLLAALGLPRMGKAYPLAYVAARFSSAVALADDDEAMALIASELGYDPTAGNGRGGGDTFRKAISRARAAVPSAARFPMAAHLDILGVDIWREPSGATPLPANFAASVQRTRAHDGRHQDDREREGTRIRPGDRTPNVRGSVVPLAPVTERRIGATTASAKVAGKVTPARRRATPAAWTLTLPAPSRRRLAMGAALMRKRVAAKSAGDRNAQRLARGLAALPTGDQA